MSDETELSPAALAQKHGLQPMGVRPKLSVYIRDVFSRRQFISVLATSKVQANNQNTYLGYFWSVLTPLLNSLVYVLIFAFLLGTRKGMDNAIAFIVVGTFTYGFFSQTLNGTAKSIRTNLQLVRSLQFPRVILPIAVGISELVALVPAAVVMFLISQIAVWKVQGAESLNPQYWILIVPAIAMLAVFSVGFGFVMARLATVLPDILKFLPFVLRITMYASGVIFAIEHQVSNPVLLSMMQYQPIAVYLNLARQAMIAESNIPFNPTLWIVGLLWAILMFAIGFIVFWRDEARYGHE